MNEIVEFTDGRIVRFKIASHNLVFNPSIRRFGNPKIS